MNIGRLGMQPPSVESMTLAQYGAIKDDVDALHVREIVREELDAFGTELIRKLSSFSQVGYQPQAFPSIPQPSHSQTTAGSHISTARHPPPIPILHHLHAPHSTHQLGADVSQRSDKKNHTLLKLTSQRDTQKLPKDLKKNFSRNLKQCDAMKIWKRRICHMCNNDFGSITKRAEVTEGVLSDPESRRWIENATKNLSVMHQSMSEQHGKLIVQRWLSIFISNAKAKQRAKIKSTPSDGNGIDSMSRIVDTSNEGSAHHSNASQLPISHENAEGGGRQMSDHLDMSAMNRPAGLQMVFKTQTID